MLIPDIDLLALIFALQATVALLVAAAVVSGLSMAFLHYVGARDGLEQRLSPPRDIRLAVSLIGAGWLLIALSHVISYWLVVPGLFCLLVGAFAIRLFKLSTTSTPSRRAIERLAILSVLTAPFVILCVLYLANARVQWSLFP